LFEKIEKDLSVKGSCQECIVILRHQKIIQKKEMKLSTEVLLDACKEVWGGKCRQNYVNGSTRIQNSIVICKVAKRCFSVFMAKSRAE
jgi:hypothetical protein